MDRRLLAPWTIKILSYIHPDFDGGLIRFLSESNSSSAITNFTIYKEWLFQSPSITYFNLFLIIASVIPIVLLLCTFVRLISLCCSLRTRSGKSRNEKNRNQQTSSKQNFFLYGSSIFMICLCILVLVYNLISFYFFTTVNSRTQQFLISKNVSVSLEHSLYRAISEVEYFLTNEFTLAEKVSIEELKKFELHLTKILGHSIKSFTSDVLEQLSITTIFNLTGNALQNLTDLMAAMQGISFTRQPLFRDLSELRGQVEGFARPILLKGLGDLCGSLEVSKQNECFRLYRASQLLKGELSEAEVSFDNSIAALTFLNSAQLNISKIQASFQATKVALENTMSSVQSKMLRRVSLTALYSSFSSMWTVLDTAIKNEVASPLAAFQNSLQSQRYFSDISRYILIFSYLACGASLLFCAFIVVVIFWISVTKCTQKRSPMEVKKDYQMKMVAASVTGQHVEISDDKAMHRLFTHQVRFLKFADVFHVTCSFVVLIPILIIVIGIFACGLYTTEVCRYLTNNRGIAVANRYVDNLIQEPFETFKSNFNFKSNAISINIKPPEHILSALQSNCSTRKTAALLVALNMTGTANASKMFLESHSYQELIRSTRQLIDNEIRVLNLESLLPKSVSTYIASAKTFLRIFVNSINYTGSITALKKPIFKLVNYTEFVKDLETFLKGMSSSTSIISVLRRISSTLNNSLSAYSRINQGIVQMRHNFKALEISKGLTRELATLENSIANTIKTLRNNELISNIVHRIYTQTTTDFSNKVAVELNEVIGRIERSILMCQPLHRAYVEITWAFCARFPTDVTAIVFCLSAITFFTLILYILSFIFLKSEIHLFR